MCSLTDICTSAGISGDVWLIFTAASRKPRVWGSLSLSAMLPLELGLWRASGEGLAEEGLEAAGPGWAWETSQVGFIWDNTV